MGIICKNVSKAFGSVKALENVDIEVKKGEVRALLGGNGSGKSTLAKILGGSVNPDTADITIGGEKYDVSSPSDAKKRGVVITSQELSLLSNLTVYENLCLCELPKKTIFGFVNKREIQKKVDAILSKLELTKLKEKTMDELASNELYLVEFIKALLQKPKVLVIDEITSALYRVDVEIVKRVIDELKRSDVIVLFISHRMQEIMAICDSVTVMRNGKSVGTFTIKEKSPVELLSLMTGREISEHHTKVADLDEKGEHQIGLKIEDLELSAFGTRINLNVRQGEIIGIAGLEGQGQSDLIRSLFGLNKPVTLEYFGEDIVINAPHKAVNNGFAYVSGNRQTEGTFQERSIAENIKAVSDIVVKKKITDVDELLKQNGVKYGSATHLITSLSGGNQQKVVIGRWTATHPRLFIAEDPTKGIDVQARRDVHKILYDIAAQGAMVIMSSSDDEEIVELTRNAQLAKVIVMYEGEIVAILQNDDITVEKIVAAGISKRGE